MEVERYNLLNPDKPQRVSYVEQCFKKKEGPILAASDYMRSHSDQIRPYVKKSFYSLGTDGFGRSDTRENLRKFSDIKIFELTNISINETLSRTIITSATTLLALLAIFFFGGEILKGFSLAMLLGVVFGTYSSIYIANTVLVRLRVSQKTVLREDDNKTV